MRRPDLQRPVGEPGLYPGARPHLSQQLADAGARIVFHSVNGDRDGSPWSTVSSWNYHESNLELRARAGKLFIVTVDNCAPLDVPCSSPGGVVGPERHMAGPDAAAGGACVCVRAESLARPGARGQGRKRESTAGGHHDQE